MILRNRRRPVPAYGERLQRMGEDKTEQLNYKSASLYVIEHIRYKYACRSYQETVVTADKIPFEPIEKITYTIFRILVIRQNRKVLHLVDRRLEV